MDKTWVVLTPLPQLQFQGKAKGQRRFTIDDTMLVQPLRPRLRRAMLNAAKASRPTDDLLTLLTEADLLLVLQVPSRSFKDELLADDATAYFYPFVGFEVLTRLYSCFLLFTWVPSPLWEACWFSAQATAKYCRIAHVRLLQPGWSNRGQFPDLAYYSLNTEPVDLSRACSGVAAYWPRLRRLSQIDRLRSIFTDQNKQKGLRESALDYCVEKEEELRRALCAANATAKGAPAKRRTLDPETLDDERTLASEKQVRKWFLEGLRIAWAKEIWKHSTRLQQVPPKDRLARAFQFFCESFRLSEPHRFVSFATCLETLFGTRRTEVTFQLASRLSWLLEPEDYGKRRETFEDAGRLYGLRSTIVHGGDFSLSEIIAQEERLVHLCRRAFLKILSNDGLFNTFCSRDSRVCDAYLEALNLGYSEKRA